MVHIHEVIRAIRIPATKKKGPSKGPSWSAEASDQSFVEPAVNLRSTMRRQAGQLTSDESRVVCRL